MSSENEARDSAGVPDAPEISTLEMLQHLEFGLWTAVVLIPVLYYANGPAVSNDQWYVRAGLVVIAYIGAPLASWLKRRIARQGDRPSPSGNGEEPMASSKKTTETSYNGTEATAE